MPKPKLTPEERKALRIQKKLDKKKQAELQRRQLKHDELSRELKYGRRTHRHHEKEWRQMLINISHPRILEDLQYAWHNFERVIDSKDFTISLLMDEIRDAEEQYMRNLRGHAANIDRLTGMFRDRLEQLRDENDEAVKELQRRAEEECGEERQRFGEMDEYLKTMVYGLNVVKKEQQNVVRGEYLSRIDDEDSKYANILQNFRFRLDHLYVDLWDQTLTFFKDYDTRTEQRRKGYEVLRNQDNEMQKILVTQLQKIQSSVELIKKLKNKFNELKKGQDRKIGDLRKERQYFADAFWTLKVRLRTERNMDAENLKTLTCESNNAIVHLKAVSKKGKHLLQLSSICRKFETLHEKVLPFPTVAILNKLTRSTSDTMDEGVKNASSLELFWKRVAQADAARYAINEEREYLKRENGALKMKIHEYCMCLECPPVKEGCEKKPGRLANVTDGYVAQKNYKKQFENNAMMLPDEYE